MPPMGPLLCSSPPSWLAPGGGQIGRYFCVRIVLNDSRPPKRVSPTGIDDVDDVRQSRRPIDTK
jgi:hypothetical protein